MIGNLDLHVGDLELSSLNEVARWPIADRTAQCVERIDLHLAVAAAAPHRSHNGFHDQPCSFDAAAGYGQRPRRFECIRVSPTERPDTKGHDARPRASGSSERDLDGLHHRSQQCQFVHQASVPARRRQPRARTGRT